MILCLILLLAFLPVADGFAPTIRPTRVKETSLWETAAVKDHDNTLHEQFSEEIEWTQHGDLKVQPKDEWIKHQLDNIEGHHEWFSEGLPPIAPEHSETEARVHRWLPALTEKWLLHDESLDLHDWFHDVMVFFPPPKLSVTLPDPRDTVGSEWFTASSQTFTPVIPAPEAKLDADDLHEWFSVAMRDTTAPYAPSKRCVTKGFATGADWFFGATPYMIAGEGQRSADHAEEDVQHAGWFPIV